MGELWTWSDLAKIASQFGIGIQTKENGMPCTTTCTSTPDGCCSGNENLLFQCCGRMKLDAVICEIFTGNCDMTEPGGLHLRVKELPVLGDDQWTSVLSIGDCRNDDKTRINMGSSINGRIRQGLGAIIPDGVGAAAVVGVLHDADGKSIAGTEGVLGKRVDNPDGSHELYSGYFPGDVYIGGSVVGGGGGGVSSDTVINDITNVTWNAGSGTGDGTITFLYEVGGVVLQGVGATIPAANGVAGGIFGLTDGSGVLIPESVMKAATQDDSGNVYSFIADGDGLIAGDLALGGQLTDLAGNPISFGGSTIAGQGADSVFSAGPADLGGAYTSWDTDFFMEATSATTNALIEFLNPADKGRVSINSRTSAQAWGIWANAPGVSAATDVGAAHFSFTDGTYYGNSSALPTTEICVKNGAGTWGMWTTGNLYVGGDAVLGGTASGAWADFVFAADYELPEIGLHMETIKEQQHLPGIQTADAVRAEGVSLNEHIPAMLENLEVLYLFVDKINCRLAAIEETMSNE